MNPYLVKLIKELNHIASKSTTIPSQMCGEAAEALQKLLDKDEIIKELTRLTADNERMQRELALSPPQPQGIPGQIWKTQWGEQYHGHSLDQLYEYSPTESWEYDNVTGGLRKVINK